MKITASQYSLGLLEAIQDKPEKDLKSIVTRFVDLLITNRDQHRLADILVAFNEAYDRAQGEMGATLVTARPLSAEVKEIAAAYLGHKTGVKKINWNIVEDKNILGGLILRYEGRVLDTSLRERLRQLKEKINQ